MMQRLQKAAVTAVMKAAPDKMKAEAKEAVKTFLDSLTEAERKSIGLGKSGDEVTDAIVGFRVPYIMGPDTEPLQTKIDNLNRYAEDIISKVSL